MNDGAEIVGYERLVVGKAEVDQLAAALQRRLAKRRHKGRKIGHRFHLPNEIVAGNESLEHPVQSRQTRAKLRVDHGSPPKKSSERDSWGGSCTATPRTCGKSRGGSATATPTMFTGILPHCERLPDLRLTRRR